MNSKIGYMQGRLSNKVDGKIQAFPWDDWEKEFPLAAKIGIGLMEWTLDHHRIFENPLMTVSGQKHILTLCRDYQVDISSLTGDCFMQAPFWKCNSTAKENLKRDFISVCGACSSLGINKIVVPLVDNGRFDTRAQENDLVDFMLLNAHNFMKFGVKIIFESDLMPGDLSRFINRLPVDLFGINYDIGNSAALGWDPMEEFSAYGIRIMNVHVKDRMFGGSTVPLKSGAAQFEKVFFELAKINYRGNYILQTARAKDGNHALVLTEYRDMTQKWIDQVFVNNSS